MVEDGHNEALRELRSQAYELRREALAFAKEKHHCDVIERAMKALPELQALTEAKKDPETKRYEQNARWNRVRKLMFGPGLEVQPESPQEEAEMLAALPKPEAGGTLEPEPKMITEAGPPGPSSQYYQEYLEARAKRKEENKEEGM
jgi:hypothetical protein